MQDLLHVEEFKKKKSTKSTSKVLWKMGVSFWYCWKTSMSWV
jgi:hypothetical protein